MATPLSLGSLVESSSTLQSKRVRILIADDTLMSCQLLKNALTQSRFRHEVVACATNRSDLMRLLNQRSVDVALVGESLQDGAFAGYEALRELQRACPSVRVVILLKAAPRDLVIDAFRAGAEGVVCRAEPVHTLCKCIQAVHKGQIWANSDQLHFLLEALISSSPLRVTKEKDRCPLTNREEEVANLVVQGMTNREIAQKLEIAEHTVSNYLFRIYEKLGITSRVELALYVVRQQQS